MVVARAPFQVEARNVILFSRREAARTGIQLPGTDSRARHIREHLKLRVGDSVRIGVVNGLKGTALVKHASTDSVALAWSAWQEPAPPAPVTLVLAMPRPRALKRLYRHIPELGVKQIVITQTASVPAGYETSETLRPKVVLEQVLQGLEQVGCTILPRIVYTPSLKRALQYAAQEWDHPDAEEQQLLPGAHESTSEKLLVQGPRVSRSFQERCKEAQAPKGPAAPEESGYKMAFLTQCLQVRRQLEDERQRQLYSGVPPESPSVPADQSCVEQPLKVVCHPGETSLLSHVVADYKKRMNAAGFHVWNWSEVHQEREVLEYSGAAGDYFYGGDSHECEVDENASLTEILAESLNAQRGGDWAEAAAATGDCAVGTTRLDASRWGLGRVVLAVGPERGWTDKELQVLANEGFSAVGLGHRTMSSAVAVTSALAITQEALR